MNIFYSKTTSLYYQFPEHIDISFNQEDQKYIFKNKYDGSTLQQLPDDIVVANELDTNLTTDENETALTRLKNEKIKDIYTNFYVDKNREISFTNEAGVTKNYQAGDRSLSEMQSTILNMDILGKETGVVWYSSDNVGVAFTNADIKNLFSSIITRNEKLYLDMQEGRSLVYSATSIEQLS